MNESKKPVSQDGNVFLLRYLDQRFDKLEELIKAIIVMTPDEARTLVANAGPTLERLKSIKS